MTSPLGQMTTIGRLRGDTEAVRLLGNSSFWPVESVSRDGQGLVKLTVLGRYGRLTYLLRADEPCRVIRGDAPEVRAYWVARGGWIEASTVQRPDPTRKVKGSLLV